jgi:CBS domain-containing protein/SAM-dependent methyltransferase
MKVSNIMSTSVDFVSENTKVIDVCRLIFGRGINGVPVCRGKKIIGFVTERDLMSKFFPSMEEFVIDPFREGNFEEMEEKADQIFSFTADKIMSKIVAVASPETPVLKAQSLMLVHDIGRLPIVNDKGELIGLVTNGDIFRAIVGDRLPYAGEEEYHDWQVRHYDVITNWEERLKSEIPDLTNLFNKYKVKNIVDIGYGTGEHDIALAKEGFSVTGIETSSLMHKAANEKRKKLPRTISKDLVFMYGNYVDFFSGKKGKFDAAIFMGNTYAHLFTSYKEVLKATSHALRSRNAVIVLQIINVEKMLTVNNRVFDINFGAPKTKFPVEQAFLRFFDPPRAKDGNVALSTVVFDFDGKKWKFRSINSTPVIDLDRDKIRELFKKNGFSNVSFYGGKFLGHLFKESFSPKGSDCLNVVAIK